MKKKKSRLTLSTSQSSYWRQFVMFLPILLMHSFQGCVDVLISSLADLWGCVEHQMCWAPVACRQHWREDPAACRTVDLVQADTDAQGHTGGPLCRQHLCTDTHSYTNTHTWEQRQQQSATVLNWAREPAAVLLLQGSTRKPVYTGRKSAAVSQRLAD